MHRHWKHRAAVLSFACLVAGGIVLLLGSAALGSAQSGSSPSPIVYTTSQQPLLIQGTSNLGGGGAPAIRPVTGAKVLPLLLPRGSAHAAGTMQTSGGSTSIVQGPSAGFAGITGPGNGAANGYDLEPPDQGLCVGPGEGAQGNPVVMEIINNSLQAFTPSGTALSPVLPTTQLFDLPAATFLSDPRCYWDNDTQRWYFSEFTFGGTPNDQYLAVSQTSNPLGAYTVFYFDTTDSANSAGGCPCYGDFDQMGADHNGFYLSTNEFNNPGSSFNGVDIWAMSKPGLAAAANGGPLPVLDRYAVTADAFGQPYHVAPAQTPMNGSYASDSEYFVESNSDANNDNHLLVYHMGQTRKLASGGFPTLAASELASEPYAFPPDATQKPGSAPSGTTVATDFNAIQQVTYTKGTLYAELETATVGPTAGIGWFILKPKGNNTNLANQGYVTNPTDSFLYPDIAVDGNGSGYLVFSVSGPDWYPSPGYIPFDKTNGPQGAAHLPAVGADDENGFTCYSPYGPPCRWGDYSMGVAYGHTIYQAAEWIPPTPRDPNVNWGTYIWAAPAK